MFSLIVIVIEGALLYQELCHVIMVHISYIPVYDV